MTLIADSNGTVQGKFTIPANVRAGTKAVRFEGAGGTTGVANFVGQGVLTTNIFQQQTTIDTVLSPAPAPRRVDPLAQTFSLPELEQIGAVDLFVVAKGATPIIIQIRETLVGMPTQKVVAETRLLPADITAGQWNRFAFSMPVTLQPDEEYAIVVQCNDADSTVGIAELGKFDGVQQAWVTTQPYQVGVLLSSSNASTWTAHQDRDLTFRLLAARYTEALREIALGDVALDGATDLLVLAVSDQQAVDAGAEIVLTMPDASTVTVGDGQVVRLPSPVTGDVDVKARLHATQKVSAILAPGTLIVSGEAEMSADYVTRAFDADATGCDVRIIYDAVMPSGAGVAVYVSGIDGGDTWQSVSQVGTAKPLGNDLFEYQYLFEGLEEASVRVKLVLTGTIAARPQVKNLRVSVT